MVRHHRSDEEGQLLPFEQFESGQEDGCSDTLAHQSKRRRWIRRILSGPDPVRIQKVEPLLPRIQRYPLRQLNLLFPTKTHKTMLLALFLVAWMIAFFVPLYTGKQALGASTGQYFINLDCVDTLWGNKNQCGLNGINCRPFFNSSFPFRCPAYCENVKVLNPRVMGPLDVNYRPLVIGDGFYRGDSFICGSAIHAGIVSGSKGGCGFLLRTGRRETFPSSNKHGIDSIAFDSYFPSSFTFVAATCSADPRLVLLFISLLFTTVFSFFNKSPSLQFYIVFTAIFAHVGLVSDPPDATLHNLSVLPDHFSRLAERFLPATFCSVILYRTCVRKTLDGLNAPFERTFFWLGGFWVGALSNYTFGWLPIQRLTAHDLEQQPGAKLTLAIILLALTIIVAQQIYCFWLEGRLLPYLALYGLFLAAIIACLAVPGLDLRIHHYIMGLLLLPGTSLQTRSSLLYQGILLGLFVNGVARWGFASILETPGSLRQDASFDSAVPSVGAPNISSTPTGDTISFGWAAPPAGSLEGVSVLVNDVERYRWFFADNMSANSFTWARPAGLGLAEYFRFAYVKDAEALDYMMAGTWFANRSWLGV